MNFRTFLLLLIFTVACACRSERKAESVEKTYFDLAGLIDQQVAYLQKNPINATKKVEMNGEKEEVKIINNNIEKSGESINWEKELALFREADINKPVLSKSYNIEEVDGKSTTYTSKELDLPVKVLKVTREGGNVSQINIAYSEKKDLFFNDREMKMFFSDKKLNRITIKGLQKLPTIDSMSYFIETDFY